MRIGFVVNPIAGMGGRVGLKGTDGKLAEARARGAEPRAPDRAVAALTAFHERAPDAEVLTFGGRMGAAEAREAGVAVTVVGEPEGEESTAADTRRAVRAFVDAGVELVLFVGGDGTAVDVATTVEDLDAAVPILGVPAGVKIYSSVFAVTPEAAGRVAAGFDGTDRREVVDIDEDAFRGGEVHTDLKALATVPVAEGLQSSKQLGGGSVEGVARAVAEAVKPDWTYVLGPGSTLGTIKERLGFEGSPLGVDVWRDGEVLVRDGAEAEILEALDPEGRNVIVISPIGGQGFVFGRGNDQISPAVIRRADVEIVASRRKLDDIGVLRVDTGDPEVDASLEGWHHVRTGRFESRLMKVV